MKTLFITLSLLTLNAYALNPTTKVCIAQHDKNQAIIYSKSSNFLTATGVTILAKLTATTIFLDGNGIQQIYKGTALSPRADHIFVANNQDNEHFTINFKSEQYQSCLRCTIPQLHYIEYIELVSDKSTTKFICKHDFSYLE